MVGESPATTALWGNQNKNGQPDAVINLGRYVSNEGLLSLSDINRLDETLRRLKQGVKFAITSGAGMATQIHPTYAEAHKGKQRLVDDGVDASRVHPEAISGSTWENAFFTRRLIEGPLRWLCLREFEIVTSEWHEAEPIFKHVYGDEYVLHFNGVEDPPSPQDLQGEISRRTVTERIVNNSPRGDLQAIEECHDWVIAEGSGIVLPQAA